jgi:glutamate decarboxylase
MAETFDKNMIDKDEYPATAAIESRCISMVADLFHAENLRDDDSSSAIGASTVGSSEAVMLAGLALKWRWRQRVSGTDKDAWKTRTPNLVMGSNVQVVWEKFCRYFDVEPRYLPMAQDRYVITPEQVVDAVDVDTIGVVGILGTTYTGELEPIAEICAALDKLQKDTGLDVPVHVDAASGGFVVPFLQPDLKWDFRLPRVASINVSGHKYGLTYPGVGFVVWRNSDQLPEELVFKVNYLGGDMPTFTLNFSKGGNQVVGQYYNFLRMGRAGYTSVMNCLSDTARWLSDKLIESEHFDVISDGSQIPVVAFKLSGDFGYNEFDVSAALRIYGWQPQNDHSAFLDAAGDHGLYVMATYFMGEVTETPVLTWQHRKAAVDGFRREVARYASHPSLLFWSFGNELNGVWNGFLTEIGKDPNQPQCHWDERYDTLGGCWVHDKAPALPGANF